MVNDGYFDESVASSYDEDSANSFDPAVVGLAVEFLAGLAAGGPLLELGPGTGRLALPLVRKGLYVHGIELSRAMVARMRAKADGEKVGITIGDFSTATAPGQYSVAYLVSNTIMNLTTQEAQVACFRNVARHLQPGGVFVIEVLFPELQRLPPGETLRTFRATEAHWGVDEYDVERQSLISHHYRLVGGQWKRHSIPFRYVWPSELDLMAQMAGMRARERWSGWVGEPFTGESRTLVGVWEKPRETP